jgi:hypothetical protein
MHTFKINGTKCVFPTGISYGLEDLHTEDSGRSTLTGIMILKILRKNVRNYTLKWELVSEEEAANILQNLKAGDYVDITIHDLLTGKDETFKYYCGGTSADSVAFCSGKIFYALNFNIIQK